MVEDWECTPSYNLYYIPGSRRWSLKIKCGQWVLEKSLTSGCNFLYEPFYGIKECGNKVQLNFVFFLLCGQGLVYLYVGIYFMWECYLLYKHQWNTRWAFTRKLDIFTCENNMLSSHVKISPLLWLHNKSRLSHQKTVKVKWFGSSLVFK